MRLLIWDGVISMARVVISLDLLFSFLVYMLKRNLFKYYVLND